MQNLLLDTNVFIDYIGHKDPFFQEAERVIAAGFFGDAKLWVSAQSLNDAFYILRKYCSSDQIQDAMAAACEIITPVDLTAADTQRALSMKWTDYEDCLIAMLAEKVKADAIITRDVHGFEKSLVSAKTPSEWLASMKERKIIYDVVDL